MFEELKGMQENREKEREGDDRSIESTKEWDAIN